MRLRSNSNCVVLTDSKFSWRILYGLPAIIGRSGGGWTFQQLRISRDTPWLASPSTNNQQLRVSLSFCSQFRPSHVAPSSGHRSPGSGFGWLDHFSTGNQQLASRLELLRKRES